MHYADGTEARTGDVVVGKGYNVKDSTGQLKTITGVMHHITPEEKSCNCRILLLQPAKGEPATEYGPGYVMLGGKLYHTQIEYGQCDHFNLASPRVPD